MSRKEFFLLLTLGIAQFTNIMDFMIMMPLGPQFMHMFNVNPQQFGALVSSYSIAAGISGFVCSFFLDRFDRKRSLILTYSGFLIGTFACAISPGYAFLVLARIFTGLFGGILSAQILAIVGDTIPYQRRAFAMSFVMASFSLASIFGVPFGLYLAAEFSWHTPFYSIAGFGMAVLMLIYFNIPPIKEHLSLQTRNPFVTLQGILTNRNQKLAVLFMIMIVLGQFTVIPFIAPYMTFNVNFTEHQLSYMYLFGGAATLISNPLLGKWADRIGKQKVFMIAAILSVIPLFIITNLPPVNIWIALTITTFFFMVISGRMTPAMTLITGTVKPEQRGSYMSIISCVQMLAAGTSTYLAGLMVDQLPGKKLIHYEHVGYLAIAATFGAIIVSRMLRVTEQERKILDKTVSLEEPVN